MRQLRKVALLACHLYDVISVETVQGGGEVGELVLTGHYGAEHLGDRQLHTLQSAFRCIGALCIPMHFTEGFQFGGEVERRGGLDLPGYCVAAEGDEYGHGGVPRLQAPHICHQPCTRGGGW